ncbi:MAG: hypothetical protein WBG38_07860 [Nodosilinea sp.]
MRTTYYPWNVDILVSWLKLELTCSGSFRDIADALQIPPHILSGWLRGSMPAIGLSEVLAISQYRSWSLHQTLRWLELKPAHIEEIMAQSPLGDQLDWSNTKAL